MSIIYDKAIFAKNAVSCIFERMHLSSYMFFMHCKQNNMKINKSNKLLKGFSAIFYVQHISNSLQFSQQQINLKIYLLTKTSFDLTVLK